VQHNAHTIVQGSRSKTSKFDQLLKKIDLPYPTYHPSNGTRYPRSTSDRTFTLHTVDSRNGIFMRPPHIYAQKCCVMYSLDGLSTVERLLYHGNDV
jgi:hypothetical protein